VLKQAGGRRGSCFGHGGHHLPLSCTLPGLNGEICVVVGECELIALSIPERQAGGPQLADDYMSPTPLATLDTNSVFRSTYILGFITSSFPERT